MIHLRQYIRSILLTESAKGLQDLPDNANVTITNKGNSFQIILMVPPGDYGMLKVKKAPSGCLGAWEVKSASASENWGPFIYDVAMEYVGDDGLMCDRRSVSSDAANVWDFFMKNRDDVRAVQLDDLRRPFVTREDPSDDCPGVSFRDHVTDDLEKLNPTSHGYFHPDKFPQQQEIYLGHWATKKYIKISGTPILDELKDRKILTIK